MEVQDEITLNPLKRCFEDMDSKPQTGDETSIPSEYERKVYEVAMRRNTIAVLENGAGKTSIQTMMIKEIGKTLKKNKGEKKLIIFLTPTVSLVHRQYEEIKSHTELEVEEYYGAKGVDEWNVKTWEKEVNEHDVLVMTPQVLLNALRKGFLSFQVLCFIILDECHFATRKHPYAKIMKEFYHKSSNRPKIFGMTASPGIRNGVFSNGECQDQISELESLLDSQVYTIEDRVERKEFILMANQNSRLYDPATSSNLELKEELESSRSKVYTIEDRMEPKEFIPLANQNCRLYDQDLPSNLELKKKLESSCSKVYTNEDRTKLKEFIPMAKQNCRLYDPAVPSNLELKEKLESLYSKVKFVCERNIVVIVIRLGDTLEKGIKETRMKT